MRKFFRRLGDTARNQAIVESKSFNNAGLSFYLPGTAGQNNSFTIEESIRYYYSTSPLYTALKLISDNLKSINFVLKNKSKDEYITEDPLLDLLDQPNPMYNGDQFKEKIISFYLLSGDVFINISGSGKPVELNVLESQYMTINSDSGAGLITSYSYNPNGGISIDYVLDPKTKRYFASNGNELINLKNFNPSFSANNERGVSYIEPIKLELAQYLLACIHNEGLLKNQARPSGILTTRSDDPLSEEQISEAKSFIEHELSGAANAAKPTFLGGNFQWQQLSESIKDMDFATLRTQTSVAIYNCLGIPLPMISPEHMSLANMDTAKLNFYDNTIIPHFKMVAKFLGNALLPRYPNSDNLELTFDGAEIQALQPRETENIERLSKSGVLTINEIRSMLGYEDLEGGNTLYQPATLIPVGQDQYTSDNRDKPAGKSVFSEKLEFQKHLSSQVDSKGKKIFKEEEIQRLTLEQYGSIN